MRRQGNFCCLPRKGVCGTSERIHESISRFERCGGGKQTHLHCGYLLRNIFYDNVHPPPPQLELSRGTSEAEIAKKDYFSAVAKDIIEKAIYGTLDAAHRYVVRIHTSVCFFFFFGVTLEVPTFIKLNHDCQACDELHAVFHGHAPSKVHCWIIDGTLSDNELWAMSWALNGIGHRIVEVSTFDWVIAV